MVNFLKRILHAIRYVFDGTYPLENQDRSKSEDKHRRNLRQQIFSMRRNNLQRKNNLQKNTVKQSTNSHYSKSPSHIIADQNLQERIKSWNLQQEATTGSEIKFLTVNLDSVKAYRMVWHPMKLTLFVLSRDESNQLQLASVSLDDLTPKTRLVMNLNNFDENSMGKLCNMVCHVNEPLLLFVFEMGMYIWNYNKQEEIAKTKFVKDKIISSGFYPDNSMAWGLIQQSKGLDDGTEVKSYSWFTWDYINDTISQHKFQLPDNYKHDVILHPSGLIIFDVARHDQGCGLLYFTQSSPDAPLQYYAKPSAYHELSDIVQPIFSPAGRQIALISRNPHLATGTKFPEIKVYDFGTVTLQYTIPLRVNLSQSDLQFGHSGKTLAFLQNDPSHLHVYSVKSQQRIALIKTVQPVTQLAVHRLYGYYAVIEKTGIKIFIDETDMYSSAIDLTHLSLEVAQKFMKDNAEYLQSNNY